MADVHVRLSNEQVIMRFWEFLAMYPSRPPVDVLRDNTQGDQVIFVLGSRNIQVPARAAELHQSLFRACPNKDVRVIVTGGSPIRDNDPTAPKEAEWFRDEMLKRGVRSDLISTETASRNTLQNVQVGLRILRAADIFPRRIFTVAVPFHMRRVEATFRGSLELRADCEIVSCPLEGSPVSTTGYTPERLIRALAGEVVRLRDYAAWGHIASVDVPEELLLLAQEIGVTSAPPPPNMDRETLMPELSP